MGAGIDSNQHKTMGNYRPFSMSATKPALRIYSMKETQ